MRNKASGVRADVAEYTVPGRDSSKRGLRWDARGHEAY